MNNSPKKQQNMTSVPQPEREEIRLYFGVQNLTTKANVLRQLQREATNTKILPKMFIFQRVENNDGDPEDSYEYTLKHETEKITYRHSFDFNLSMVVKFIFEQHQHFRIECFDMGYAKRKLLGVAEFEVGQVIGSQNNRAVVPLISKKK